jgi:hypothetical protein
MEIPKEERDLARKVAKRQATLKEFVKFAEDIAHRRGREVERRQGSSHTNVKREFLDFGGFSFFTEGTLTMFGGHNVKITQTVAGKTRIVLELYYQSAVEEAKIDIFDESLAWRRALRRVKKDEEKIAAMIKMRNDTSEKRREAERERLARSAKLHETAERLKI